MTKKTNPHNNKPSDLLCTSYIGPNSTQPYVKTPAPHFYLSSDFDTSLTDSMPLLPYPKPGSQRRSHLLVHRHHHDHNQCERHAYAIL